MSAPNTAAALRSALPTGPLCLSSEPSSLTDTERSERKSCSPKKRTNSCPTADFRNAVPPQCPGVCHEYSYSSAKRTIAPKNGGRRMLAYFSIALETRPATNVAGSSSFQMYSSICSTTKRSMSRTSVRSASKKHRQVLAVAAGGADELAHFFRLARVPRDEEATQVGVRLDQRLAVLHVVRRVRRIPQLLKLLRNRADPLAGKR